MKQQKNGHFNDTLTHTHLCMLRANSSLLPISIGAPPVSASAQHPVYLLCKIYYLYCAVSHIIIRISNCFQ